MAPGMMAASHFARGIEAGLAHLAAIIAADGGALPMPAGAAEALSAAADGWRPLPAPIGMVATPCSQPAARWHLDQLAATTAHDAARRAKRLLHARFLGYLLSPDDPRFRPLVTILIPVYNRAALCVEAVESCLAQSWRPLEILVVDDGSTDDLASALQQYGDAVRLLRKPNGGVSSARNAGIAAARGDFIHFLDSDNLLLPDAVAAKVAAFTTVADAELCYGVGLLRTRHGRTKFSTHIADGSRQCPTRDLMAAVAWQYPFWVSTVMLARWTAWDGVAFEEDLRSAEDLRYWAALAFRGTKAIGFWRPLMVRRMFPQSLGGRTSPYPDARVTARLRNLRDALTSQRHWRHAGGFYRQMLYRHAVDPILDEPTALVQRTMDELRAAIARLGDAGHWEGRSALPVLAELRGLYRGHLRDPRVAGRRDVGSRLLAELDAAISNAIEHVPDLAPPDVAFWVQPPRDGAVQQFLAALCSSKRRPQRRCAEASAILRSAPFVPSLQDTARYRRIRRWLGATAARAFLRARPAPNRTPGAPS